MQSLSSRRLGSLAAYATMFVMGVLASTTMRGSLSRGMAPDFDIGPLDLPSGGSTPLILSALLGCLAIAILVAYFLMPARPGATGTREDAGVESGPDARAERLEAIRLTLEKQLTDLSQTVGSHLHSTTDRAQAFSSVQAKLAEAETTQAIQAVVALLVETSNQALRDTQELRANLKSAEAQSSALRQRLADAEKIAAIDPLTSVPNRRSFQEFLDRAVAQSHHDYLPLCLIMADIDHFKKINDQHGHVAGDEVLRQFAQTMTKSVRSTDFVARYGGEEFALILKNTPMGNAVEVAERVRQNIQSAKWTDGTTRGEIGPVTVSLGVAEIRDDEKPGELIERADRRLYLAKRNGRNRIEIDALPR
ncbi:MAG: GGDEF domain-containing protein [Hyphomicrobium sp.]